MIKDIEELAEYVQTYISAIQNGYEKFVSLVPIMTKQHIEMLAKNKLDSSKDNYMSALKVTLSNDILVVELDKDNWLANAVESGAEPFDMKRGHLHGKKFKVSNSGWRYIRIPLGQDKNKKPGTASGQEFQKKIMDVLSAPKFGLQKLKVKMDGSVSVSQEILSAATDLGGLYRIQEFDSISSFHGKKKPFKTQMVLFRTMSDNPAAKSQWNHPGIEPKYLLRQTEQWLGNTVGDLLETMVESELRKVGLD